MSKESAAQSLRRNLLNFLLVTAFICLVFGCFCRSDRDFSTPPSASTPTPSNDPKNSATNKTSGDQKGDKGDFKVEHVAVKNPDYKNLDQQIKDEKLLEDAATQLNRNLKLPADVVLRTKDCNEINAFYDPNDISITICYELMDYFFALFKSTGKSDQESSEKMFEAIRFVFLHELGHALIDLYKLPITGNEEDAADRASAYICLEEIKGGERSVFAAAEAFSLSAKGKSVGGREMADEHLLQEQRFYNFLCMIYGSNTSKYQNLVGGKYLPQERAVRCPSEYERTTQSWKELLKPWRKS
jgi:hypothetical protein